MAMRTICGYTFEILRYAQDDREKCFFSAKGAVQNFQIVRCITKYFSNFVEYSIALAWQIVL